jgi:hypothetical protein
MNVCPTEQIGVIEIGRTGILACHLLVGRHSYLSPVGSTGICVCRAEHQCLEFHRATSTPVM